MTTNTRALLDSLCVDKFVLVGHSMGGILAVRQHLLTEHHHLGEIVRAIEGVQASGICKARN
ncbi:MAG TPA: alpha/beta hydrolase [Pyrinomonadaceae bacterium]